MVVNAKDQIGIELAAKTKKFTTPMTKASGQVANFDKSIQQASLGLKRFEKLFLGAGLAALFTGMAIKNAAQQALNATFKTFQTVTEGTMLYNETLGRLSAAFEFLKFQIAETFLTSELGKLLLDVLVGIFDKISGLPEEFQVLIGAGLVFFVILGGVLMVLGQMLLALLGIVAALEFMGFTTGASFLPKLFLVLGVVAVIFGIFSLIVGAVLAARDGNIELAKKLILVATIVTFIAVVLALMFGAPIAAIAILIAFVVAMGLALKFAGAEFKLAFFKAIRDIGNFMIKAMLEPINRVIRAFNRVRRMMGKSTLDQIKIPFTGLDSTIAKAEQEVAANRAAKAEQEEKRDAFRAGNNIQFFDSKIMANNVDDLLDSAESAKAELAQRNLLGGTGG